jgi:UDP-glucose 4-epimerase
VQSFLWKLPATETVILRPVHVVGPHVDNLATRYLRLHRVPRLLGFDPMIQLIHEEDVVHAIVRALAPGVRGVFNIAGQTQAPLSRLLEARGATALPIPGPLFAAALARASALRMTSIDPGELAFLRYSCLIDGKRARDELGYQPRHTLRQTLEDLG